MPPPASWRVLARGLLAPAWGVPRASWYRAQVVRQEQHTVRRPRRSPLALSVAERDDVLEVLHSPEYVDVAPRTVYAMLLDAGTYMASASTFYRILRATSGTRPRRNELVHPAYARPELLALRPCEVWSWDITKLKGPIKSAHFHLYVILDIFSRYVVGWMIADARAFCQTFFAWYNYDHRHSGIGYMTPAAMHTGVAPIIYEQRDSVLQSAFAQHPNRFKNRQPRPPALPTEAGINMPKPISGGEEKARIAP